MARTEPDRTPGKTIKVPTVTWNAYRNVLQRLGSKPTDDIRTRIREVIEAHGTPEEIEQLRAGDRELEERKKDRYRRAAQSRRALKDG
ncbi:hypothetical protein [Actinomadura madurae]|uniref:hypothetical protein n=1 Tax=Actinomadura madurae TaxID=1993 RepID=UPI0020D22621|nr:hypothetical protein [Actinomadura madurae]MCP9947309.1 hypothetical protein [Actinomadura madurae]MCP9964071.1 hypothetical protein [Actinomadura madurae]MCP9976545.1 hypothetical protein [Actinomadura madurae]MCQ0011957.1 hypothetical protein [Actinomadura madurae]MCQ0012742.1 hypothetical protein [Actinomadura madurae]